MKPIFRVLVAEPRNHYKLNTESSESVSNKVGS